MKENPLIVLGPKRDIVSVSDGAVPLLGIPRDELIGRELSSRLITEHRTRFNSELDALYGETEQHGRVYCTVIGLDGIGRRLAMVLTRTGRGGIQILLSPYTQPDSQMTAPGSSLLDSGRLLPVARRISTLSRRALSKEALLGSSLDILAEVTSAIGGAAIELDENQLESPMITVGKFDRALLKSVFRPAILSRLTRGDVVVKETNIATDKKEACLLVVPLLSSSATVGFIALLISGYTVLVPEEQLSLTILGEIIGLGIKALSGVPQRDSGIIRHRGDTEAYGALGRLSAGLAHEINNAVTVLRSNLEQLTRGVAGQGLGLGLFPRSAVKDSFKALDVIQDLNDALRSFAPEETELVENVDLLRVIAMVVRSIRFYAKRGMNVSLEPPEDAILQVQMRSHFLIRSLFLIFVELVEASYDSGIELNVEIRIQKKKKYVVLHMSVTAGPISLPTMLLAQLEHGGALSRHVSHAGGILSHEVSHTGNLNISLTMPAVEKHTKSVVTQQLKPTRRGTILVVDDEHAVIRSLRRLLERDHDILAARSGEEALDLIKSHPDIEVILYDVSMPRINGIEFYKELKKIHSPILDRIVFVSGGAGDAEVSRFLSATSNHTVEKPFDLTKLNEIIASLLQ